MSINTLHKGDDDDGDDDDDDDGSNNNNNNMYVKYDQTNSIHISVSRFSDDKAHDILGLFGKLTASFRRNVLSPAL